MSLTLRKMTQLLTNDPRVSEWVVHETRTRRVTRELGPRPSQSSADLRRLGALVLVDGDQGRGAAPVDVLDAEKAEPDQVSALITRAAAAALQATGPAWLLPAPAAPARVQVADNAVLADPVAVLDGAVAEMVGAVGRTAILSRARVSVDVVTRIAATSRQFTGHFRATTLDLDAIVARPGRPQGRRARARARRTSDLTPGHWIERAARGLRHGAGGAGGAGGSPDPAAAGRYDLVLSPDALAGPDPDGFGWFASLVANGSQPRARLGLSRYRAGQRVFDPDAPPGDPFTLISDGTLPFAQRSAPFGPLGEPVRRFTLVQGGVADGAALGLREAALAGVTPNGGPRNLVLSPGETAAADLRRPGGARPLLAVDALAWLEVDPLSGGLMAEIASGTVHRAGGPPTPVGGGLLVGSTFDLLARARLSREIAWAWSRWYRGPVAVRIDDVAVVA